MVKEIFLALYSRIQKAYHIETLSEYEQKKIKSGNNGYLPVFSSEDQEEVREYIDKICHK